MGTGIRPLGTEFSVPNGLIPVPVGSPIGLFHEIYICICHSKCQCICMVIHININTVFFDGSTAVFCCEYMSTDDNFCSIWNYIWIYCNCLTFYNRSSCGCNSCLYVTTNLTCTIICDLEITKTLSIHILCCIDFADSGTCYRILII